MTKSTMPFPEPESLEPDLARVRSFWQGLRRGQADMPFWDDVKIGSLPDLADRVLLLDAMESPRRFRFTSVGRELRELYGEDLAGRFTDEIAPRQPFEFLDAQCSAAVEGRTPTYYRHVGPMPYARLLLPLWGDGFVAMLLGATAWLER